MNLDFEGGIYYARNYWNCITGVGNLSDYERQLTNRGGASASLLFLKYANKAPPLMERNYISKGDYYYVKYDYLCGSFGDCSVRGWLYHDENYDEAVHEQGIHQVLL
jgi:hypothetical protein